VSDVALIHTVPPPGIFQQAFYQNQLLEVHDDRIPVPPAGAAEPVTVAFARGLRGEYVIVDWLLRGGADVFTARQIGDPDHSSEWRVSILPWWWSVLAGGTLVGLAWTAKELWPRGEPERPAPLRR